jgi:hypothetical protein
LTCSLDSKNTACRCSHATCTNYLAADLQIKDANPYRYFQNLLLSPCRFFPSTNFERKWTIAMDSRCEDRKKLASWTTILVPLHEPRLPLSENSGHNSRTTNHSAKRSI